MKKQILLVSTILFIGSLTHAQADFSMTATGAVTQIHNLVQNSSCRNYSWKNRGKAPSGYIQGVSLAFVRSLCREKSVTPSGLARIMSQADTRNDNKDALTHYQSIFSALGIRTNLAGEETLRALYTLGMGLGMRESSGKYCEGWDSSAGPNRPSAEAESGPFQVSYNSMNASTELRKLYEEYQASPSRCNVDTFKPEVSCGHRGVLGTGDGARFQAFNKACPAFATEYAMTLLRVLRGHFGPINRVEAQVVPVCEGLLTDVQQIVDANPESVCQQIF